MVTVGRGTTFALDVSTYVFPVVAFPLLAWAFWLDHGAAFAVFAMGVPLVFGYVVPGIGTNAMRRWRFHGRWVVGSYYAHHGFLYAAKLAFVLWLAMRHPATMTAGDVAAAAVLGGAFAAIGGYWHDVNASRAGRIEHLTRAAREGRSTEAVVAAYTPALFALGATYVLVSAWAYRILVAEARPEALPWVFAAGVVVLAAVPALAFLALDGGRAKVVSVGRLKEVEGP